MDNKKIIGILDLIEEALRELMEMKPENIKQELGQMWEWYWVIRGKVE